MALSEQTYKPVIGILLGDSSGIGPEIVAKVAAKGGLSAGCKPVIIGDIRVLKAAMKIAKVDFEAYPVDNVEYADWNRGIPVLDQKNQDPGKITMGKVNPCCGRAVGDMIVTAIDLFKAGRIGGFCYAPFNKAAMRLGGYNYESEHEIFRECFKWTGYSLSAASGLRV